MFSRAWHFGLLPMACGPDEKAAAQVLLRVGSLDDRTGSARQIEVSQERAKDFLTENRKRLYTPKGIRRGRGSDRDRNLLLEMQARTIGAAIQATGGNHEF